MAGNRAGRSRGQWQSAGGGEFVAAPEEPAGRRSFLFDDLLDLARRTGRADDPVLRQQLADAYLTLEILRFNQLRMLTVEASGGVPGPEMSIGKLYWASWHRALGELKMAVRGASAMVADPAEPNEPGAYVLDNEQRSFLYSRAHTIYGGSNEIQRNILGERVLGLPREPRV